MPAKDNFVTLPVYVRADGCIGLGTKVTCDGFAVDVPIRIQTHVHYDHLTNFDRSKGAQKRIVMSEATYALLVAEGNADLPYRSSQILRLPADGNFYNVEDVRVALFPSGHMIGGVMAVVEENGCKVAYTSDFSWPLTKYPTDIHTLIIDATYGNPAYRRNYNEDEIVSDLIEIVTEKARGGPVIITGHRGRLQSAASIFSSYGNLPLLLSDSVAKTFDVYAKYSGISLDRAFSFRSMEGRRIAKEGNPFIGFIEARDRVESVSFHDATRILLSAYMVPKQDPVLFHSSGLIRIALTDHADFQGTIELVKAINPQKVIADGSRGGDAEALSSYINSELRIFATAETLPVGPLWGQ
jgi:putative mRNA 3-end processing factor